jgi:DNA-binding response OmpR family regulator
MSSILVIDDEDLFRTSTAVALRQRGFDTLEAGSGRVGAELARRHLPDLVLCDVNMEHMNGYQTLETLRREPATASIPFILMTGLGDTEAMRKGMEMGADDYLPKPFNPRELVARIHAVLRRHGERAAMGAPTEDGRIRFGEHTLDLAARTLDRDGQTTSLTTGEFALIKVFVQHPRQPLAREKLMLLARGRDHEVFDRAIDVQVSRLRKLVEPDPTAPRYIQTVWGFGYVYVPEGTRLQEPATAPGNDGDSEGG